jgi:class 3 adenylate cyclase
MADSAKGAHEDDRLTRAENIVAELRANPALLSQDPIDLAIRFEVEPALMHRILRTRALADRRVRRPRFSLKKLLLEIRSVIGRAVQGVTIQPYAYLLVVSLLYVISGAFSVVSIKFSGGIVIRTENGMAAAAGALYFAAQMLCLFVRPHFKYLVAAMFGSLVSFSIVVWLTPMSNTAVGTRLVFALGGGIGFLFLIAFFGTGFLLAGASVQAWVGRRREENETRQQLLSRLFNLQSQLATLPPEAARPPNVLIQRLRKNLFWWSAAAGLLETSLALGMDRGIRLHPGGGRAGFDPEVVVVVVGIALISFLSTVAGSAKRGLLVAGALAVSEALPYLGILLFRGATRLTTVTAGSRYFDGIMVQFVVIAVVLYAHFIQRELKRLRREGVPNEAAIVGDILDVKQRLAAASVKVYVMVADVFGSTKMKEGADPLKAEFSFRNYQSWVAETAAAYSGSVEATTGDGAIVAFGTPGHALACTLSLQRNIDAFNKDRNLLQTPFRLRVSLHSGLVVGQLNKVQFTEVIDVAAHVEKASPVGGFAATMDFLTELTEPLDGVSQGPMIDGRQVYVCEPVSMALMPV